MAYKDKSKETSKWVLGGDGITNVRGQTKESIELAKQLNKKKQLVKKTKK